jgi:hypothetical protein
MKSSIVFLLLLLCPSVGLALHTEAPSSISSGSYTKHYEQSLFEVTEKGLFSVEMVIKEKELKVGVNTLDIIVHDRRDKDVVGAIVTVTPWMPEMGHGVFEKPFVTERGGGIYSVENIILIMRGRWELKIKIRKEDTEDSVTFDFPDVNVSETPSPNEHQPMYSSAPADVDTSTVRMSEKKLFKVSYVSENVPIPIGRIITWKLSVETADGLPAKNAEITVNGDMPEHGHGLPTQPEVVKGAEDGSYIVQGLKFSMPGWWVITYRIKAQGMDDSVSFNLVVQ